MRKYFKPLMIVAAMTTSVSALAIKRYYRQRQR
jgi:hypothetical protein